jgi:hypothetical protein
VSAVTGVEKELKTEIFDEPRSTDQIPVPVVGLFAASVAVVAQTVCEVPALETEGNPSRWIVTVDADAGHTPLDTVHTNLFIPTLNELTAVVNESGVATDAGTESDVHAPTPTDGLIADNVALAEQIVCEGPANDCDGRRSTLTVSVFEGYMHAAPVNNTRR